MVASDGLQIRPGLPLVFADPTDYERILKDDRLTFLGLDMLTPGKPVQVQVQHADATLANFQALHSLTLEQIAWFQAGSALNLIRQQQNA